MTMSKTFTVSTEEDELREGLFGQVLLLVFEALPYLSRNGLHPPWAIRSKLYGAPDDSIVLPGVLDLAYEPESNSLTSIPLSRLNQRFGSALGDDWIKLSSLWGEYFRIPSRTLDAANAQGSLAGSLGVHYRGHDKGEGSWDSNPVSHDDMTIIVLDALSRRPELQRVFVATDDYAFVGHLQQHTGKPVSNLGSVTFHKSTSDLGNASDRADRALLDCLLLSRCGMVLLNSSALSAFAKILNPKLEIYRCAASMLFADVPYFPVAYIPVYESESPVVQSVMTRTMASDWRHSPRAAKFARFAAMPRYPVWTVAWAFAKRMDRLLGRFPPGLRPDRLGRTLAGLRPRGEP